MIKRITKDIEKLYKNKPHRLDHVYGVRDTAIILGKKHNVDLFKLELAALLHDITKYYSLEENIDLIKKEYQNSEEILNEYNHKILHAFSAVYVAEKHYGINDKDVLDSIMSHTIGRPNMSIYEKIIFLSDYIEPGRTYESCVKVREISKRSLDEAVYIAIDDSIVFYEKEKALVPKTSYQARDFYKKLLEEEHGKNSISN